MSFSLRAAAPWVLCLLLVSPGCRRDDGPKLVVVQALAKEMGAAKRLTQRTGCGLLVEAQRDELLCDGLLQTLLHYAPGFPGSQVTQRAPSQGGRSGQPLVLPVRYKGPQGEGALDVHLLLEGTQWRIAALLPRPQG